MDIVDKKYVDDRDITSITSPDNIAVNDLTYINNKKIVFNKANNPITMPLNTFGVHGIDKLVQIPDNGGNGKLLLIANITTWYTNTSDTNNNSTLQGFSGVIHGIRNSGYMVTDYAIVTAMIAWINNGNQNTITLESSNDRYKPCIVKYNNKYYIAISILGSGYNVFLRGYHNTVDLDKFIILTSNANAHLTPIDGVEYVMIDKIKNYYPINAATSQTAELANSVKEASIDIMKLDMQARRPYVPININSLNNIDYDTIVNLIWDTYGTNGNQAMPTIGVTYTTTNNGSSSEYNRQLIYNPNLGTFQYRNKVITSNTWDVWTPIPIPQTTVKFNSYKNIETINNLLTTGFYILTNNSAINDTSSTEFIIVHNNTQGIIFQTHYAANGNILARNGNLNNNIVDWNEWVDIRRSFNLVIKSDEKLYNRDGTLVTYEDFNYIVSLLAFQTDLSIHHNRNITVNCMVKTKNNTKTNTATTKLYDSDKLIISFFDFDSNAMVYFKVYFDGENIIVNKKQITYSI